MGLGDEIIVTGEVERLLKERPNTQFMIAKHYKGLLGRLLQPKPVVWRPAMKVVYYNNPHIIRKDQIDPQKQLFYMNSYNKIRPYIKDTIVKNKVQQQILFNDYSVSPGKIYFDDKEKDLVEKVLKPKYASTSKQKQHKTILLHPSIKRGSYFAINKDWGINRWKQLVSLLKDNGYNNLVQLDDTRGVHTKLEDQLNVDTHIQTPSFRYLACLMKTFDLIVTTEGAIHHLAAALGKPAVVIFGGRVHPNTFGYEFHKNIYVHAKGEQSETKGCGMFVPCDHCKKCMEQISPKEIFEKIEEALDESLSE